MHVDGVKAGTMEGGRHFNVEFTLLAQDGHFGRAPVAMYGAATSSLISNELHVRPGSASLAFA